MHIEAIYIFLPNQKVNEKTFVSFYLFFSVESSKKLERLCLQLMDKFVV